MSSDNVTVVDQYGKLLSKPEDDPNIALTEKQLNHRIKLSLFIERILSLVTPMVGAGNLTAQVNVEMDFAKHVTEKHLIQKYFYRSEKIVQMNLLKDRPEEYPVLYE